MRLEARAAGQFQQLGMRGAGAGRRPALGQRFHQAQQRGERHCVVPGPGAQRQHIVARIEQGTEEAAFADARFAGHDDHLEGGPGLRCRRQFGVAPDHAGRPQHRRRQGLAADPGAGLRLLDGLQQRQRLGRRPGADLVLQHLLAVVEGKQGGRAIAAQVMQPHRLPMGVLGSRIGFEELLRHELGCGELAGALQPRRVTGERLDVQRPAALALAGQPGREARRVGFGDRRQQLTRAIVSRPGIDLHMGRQAGDQRAFQQLEADQFAQPKQALTQVGAGALRVHIGPQHRRQRAPRRRPFDGQIGQQQRVLRLQHQLLAGAVNAHSRADQAQDRAFGKTAGEGRGMTRSVPRRLTRRRDGCGHEMPCRRVRRPITCIPEE